MIKRIKKSNFYKITFGSVLAQIIVVLVSPITTRIYSPSQLGVYTLLISIVTLVLPVINLKLDTLIVSNREEIDLSVYTSFLIGLLISIVTFFFTVFFLKNQEHRFLWSSIVFLVLFFSSANNIGIALSNSEENYSLIGNFNFIKSLIQNVFLVVLGLMKLGITGMLFSQLLGCSSGTIKMYKSSSFKISRNNFPKVKEVICHIKSNLALIVYSAPAHFVNSLSYNILNFFITGLFGSSIFGFYSLAFRILGIPLTVVSQNFSKVFFKDAADEWETNHSFSEMLKKHTIILTIIAINFAIGAILFGPSIFEFVFGPNWKVTGKFVQILAPMFAIRLVVSSLTPAFLIAGKQNMELLMQIFFLIVSIFSYIICKFLNAEITFFLRIISFSYSVIYVLGYFKIKKLSKGE